MSFLSQTRFPRLWGLFQYFIGGTVDKRKIVQELKLSNKSVLEIGCSIGNIAQALLKVEGINYTGLDIDENAISLAQRRFKKYGNFNFINDDLFDFSISGNRFDSIIFAGVCHHVDEKTCLNMVESADQLLKPDGQCVIVDPVFPLSDDPKLFHRFIKLEQGEHVRTRDEFDRILSNLSSMTITNSYYRLVGATPLSVPKVARFVVYILHKKPRSN